MLGLLKLITRLAEAMLAVPTRLASMFLINVAFNPRLGALRYLVLACCLYVIFAVALVYVFAPLRGMIGAQYLAEKLRYDAERWVATAIYDSKNDFVGTYDPRLDSQRDVNFTSKAIAVGGYTANPDHKSIPVRDVPDDYWQCLLFHEDRYLGGWRNPYGIDLAGIIKIPYTSIQRTLRRGRPSFGVGGSTLPMQLVRVIYKTPPRVDETPWEKLGRKFQEWWLAPVVYHELTRNGDATPLKRWVANHLWLAQRTGGQPLHGVEVTSRIVFGKSAKHLSKAEQYVLASAVNKPIILLPGSDRLNAVRLDRWRYISEVRASRCATELIADPDEQKKVVLELVRMAGGPPDPQVKPRLRQAMDAHAPGLAKRAEANPRLRANVLLPSVRLGAREEMKQAFGFNWRAHVRGLTTTIDAAENLAFRAKVNATLSALDKRWSSRLKPGFTLDPVKGGNTLRLPDVVVVAADRNNRIVRYYESSQTAPYFGSIRARDRETGRYDRNAEGRMIASTGKILAAVAIANEGRDSMTSVYLDRNAPRRGLETCRRGGDLRRGRSAQVAFACSLNGPLEWRTAKAGQSRIGRLIDGFGFQRPPSGPDGATTPNSTAAVRGLIAGSPRRVHHMSATVLAALTGRGDVAQHAPSLIKTFDYASSDAPHLFKLHRPAAIRPYDFIRRGATPLIKGFLQSPLCYRANGRSHGTLRKLNRWCAGRRKDVRTHFAKTGTQVNIDPDETVDVWATGGLQFTSGAAYSYVVMVGTGTPNTPFARSLHSGQVAAPLVNVLLRDLANHARKSAAQRHGRPRPRGRDQSASVASRQKQVARTSSARDNASNPSQQRRTRTDAQFSVHSIFERIAQQR